VTLDRDRVAAALAAYDVGGELGRGGWGVVLSGTHRQLGREVAIKELPRAFAGDPTVRARFVAEARLLASLDHPHIVPVYDFVEHEGLCLLVMEQLPGGTLWAEFSTKGLVPERAIAVVLAACTALHFAHQRGILHRDIKPENLMYNSQGVVKVTDFGIAKVIGGGGTMATIAGDILGTPAYMAPEQARGGELSPATDVYAVGTMMYELLSGRLPHSEDGDPLAILYRHVNDEPVPLRDVMPSVPEPIANVVMKSLSKDPLARQQSCDELGIELAEAATIAWGPGWLNARSGVSVMAAGEMVAVTERTTGGAVAPVAQAPAAPSTIAPTPVDAGPAPATILPSDIPAAAAPPPPAPAPAPAPVAPAAAPVRPSIAVHAVGAAVNAAEEDIVPVKEIITPPGSAAPMLLAALVLIALLIGAAFAGVGSPTHDKAGTGILVNGKDPGSSTLSGYFSDPRKLGGVAAGSDVAVKVGGVSVASAKATASADAPDQTTADLGAAKYLVGGKGTLELSAAGAATKSFEIKSSQSGFLTAPAVVAIILLLFAFAYTESLSKPLRRGRKRMGNVVGVAVMVAIAGVALTLIAWILGAAEPSIPGIGVSVILGALAGAAFALGQLRRGQRRRLRRGTKT